MTPRLPTSTLALTLICACGGGAQPEPPAPNPTYAPPAVRIDPPAARTMSSADFAALGRARSHLRRAMELPSTSVDRYVASTGDDGADGSEANPWRTLQHAADAVEPGTTVHVAPGDYPGPLDISRGGADGAFVVFRNAGDVAPRITGGGDFDALVNISASYVVFAGFELTGHARGVSGDRDVIGIQVEPSGADVSHVWLLGNWVHDIGPGPVDDQSCYYNGHGIIAQAEGERITNLIVDGNELSELYVGHSECLVINGNVDTFRVTNNYVHDVNNIGIDIIGYEKNRSETTQNGLIADNVVLDASNYWPYCTRGNCAYPAADESSDGIYVDGGASLVIEYNVVGRADHGIELQSENGELIRDVEVRFNVVFNSYYENFTLGAQEDSTEHDNVFFDDPALEDATFAGCGGG